MNEETIDHTYYLKDPSLAKESEEAAKNGMNGREWLEKYYNRVEYATPQKIYPVGEEEIALARAEIKFRNGIENP